MSRLVLKICSARVLYSDQESLFFLIVIRVHSINTDVFTFCYLADAEDVVMESNEENEEQSKDKRYNHGLEPGSCVRCLKSIGNVPLCVREVAFKNCRRCHNNRSHCDPPGQVLFQKHHMLRGSCSKNFAFLPRYIALCRFFGTNITRKRLITPGFAMSAGIVVKQKRLWIVFTPFNPLNII
ncbi:hypothetical protein HCDG_09297 [Histoplasma capsulatum H143]|uniref:Uncharacterized protein n=1 Tax=Ajellomyces capsulatus (strain H143) TaxID=544712 RepID=C6HSW6_AJECH|nr:hypothetical protein HCDG_09297 [Histoplasma capsulatum H143]